MSDGIDSEMFSLSYASVDDAVRCLKMLGRGALLAKCDITKVYGVVPFTQPISYFLELYGEAISWLMGPACDLHQSSYEWLWLMPCV